MAEDITSEQAWEDFKAGYSDFEEKHIGKDRDGDKASLDQKIDVMSAKLEELNTDIARLNDSIPQALGTIEEGKTIEAESEEDADIGTNPEGEAEGGGLFGDDDDGLDEYFADEESDENGEPIDDEANPDVAGDEEEASGESTEQTDETSVNADGNSNGAEVDVEEDTESTDVESTDEESAEDESAEEDFTPIEDIMSEDESTEEETPDEEEEVLEKMVRILNKMDKRISRLERENEGLKKQLSKRMTVQTPASNMAKSRPTPNTNLRLVKGSYNRPPVSTQYSANQRDVGVGIAKKKSEGANTSVFNTELNEVFAECNRIANKTR